MTETADARILEGRKLTREYAGWAAGAGLTPIPLLDVAGLMATQIALLHDLSRLFGVPFDRKRARLLLSAAAASLAPQGVAGLGGVSALKAVPVIGGLLGMAAMPVLAVGSTMAVGEWFLRHLAAGGTLADAELPPHRAAMPVDEVRVHKPGVLEATAPVPAPKSAREPTSTEETDVDVAVQPGTAPAVKRSRARRSPLPTGAQKGGDAG